MINAVIYIFIAFIGFMLYKKIYQEAIYHGPVANEVIKHIYFDEETNKYYKFNIKMFMCPPSLQFEK
jgi:hypothetical protein